MNVDSVIIFCAKYLFIAVPLLFAVVWLAAGNKTKRQMAAAVIATLILAVILDKLSGKLYYDPRPFTTHHVKPLITHPADNGFPSEHTLFTMTIGAVLFFYRKRLGLLAMGISLVVGIARVAAHVHSPIDIIGAIVLGLASGWAGQFLAVRYLAGTKPGGGRQSNHIEQ